MQENISLLCTHQIILSKIIICAIIRPEDCKFNNLSHDK